METKELYYPQISAQAGSYTFEEGVELEIYSSKSSYYDWAKIRFTSQFRPKLSLKKKDPATIQLGYDGTLEDVFTGFVSGNYDGGTYQATLGQQETIELTREKWLSLTNGQHQLRIEAVDGNFATSVRVFSFSKKETVIKFELVAPEETDAAATKVLVTPTWKIEGAVAKVEACNNGFDAVPTWEDITAMVQINRVYNFTNKTKTASKWGVNIRFTITKNEGFEGEVSISGFGGAYE